MNSTLFIHKIDRRTATRWALHAALATLAVVTLAACQSKPPTKACDAVLEIGHQSYHIQTLEPNADGSLSIPEGKAGEAYWLKGTSSNSVFGLSPSAENLSLGKALKEGDTANLTWENCNTVKFQLRAPQAEVPGAAALVDQSAAGITVFSGAGQAGFMVRGEVQGETITTFSTPAAGEVQAEVSLLETSTSADQKTLQVSLSILNSGKAKITLSSADAILTPKGGAAGVAGSSEPGLPVEIKPGATETIKLTFPRPTASTATLKVLGVEYELEGY